LVAIVVDRLLAQDDQAGLLRVGNRFQDLGDRQRLDRAVGLDEPARPSWRFPRSSSGP
jgi:hypothetical protein